MLLQLFAPLLLQVRAPSAFRTFFTPPDHDWLLFKDDHLDPKRKQKAKPSQSKYKPFYDSALAGNKRRVVNTMVCFVAQSFSAL